MAVRDQMVSLLERRRRMSKDTIPLTPQDQVTSPKRPSKTDPSKRKAFVPGKALKRGRRSKTDTLVLDFE